MAPTKNEDGEPKRGRGRPAAGQGAVQKKQYVPTGRPRGRPPTGAAPKAPYVPTGKPRGRPKGSGGKKGMPEATKRALAAARQLKKEAAGDDKETKTKSAKKGGRKSDTGRKSYLDNGAESDIDDADGESG